MEYNLANLSAEARAQLQAEKSASYLAWQEQQGQLTPIQTQQYVEQQPEALQPYFLSKLNEYRKRLA